MKKAVLKFTACCLAAGMTFAGTDTVALAATNNNGVLAGFRMGSTQVIEAKETSTEEKTSEEKASEEQAAEANQDAAEETVKESAAESQAEAAEENTAADTAEENTAEEYTAEEYTEPVQTEPVRDTSLNGEMAFAQCQEYINIRSSFDVNSEVVGKVYNNCSVTILSQIGDWYEVQTGNAVGYVKAEYFAIGAQADAIAEEVAYNVATVYPEALTIRSEASTESDSIGMAYSSDELEVVAYEGDWMKVALGNDVYGYVNAYYVDYDTYYATGETLEEEQERLDAEWLAYLAEQEAEQERLNQQWIEYLAEQEAEQARAEAEWLAAVQQQSSSAGTQNSTSAQDSSSAQATADALYQEYLNAQAAADAATQQADEQLVYDTAEDAQQAYQEYLSAQNAADAAAQAAADAAAQQQAQQQVQQQQPTVEEQPQPEVQQPVVEEQPQPEVQEPVQEQPQPEVQEPVQEESSSSSSSLGQQAANYAVQFVGNPYVWGGTSLTNGADCSGFVQSVFRNFGISIPRTAASQSGSGTSVSLSDIQPGDLLFYSGGGSIGHVTMYIGNGQVVHASSPSTGIVISSYSYRTPVSARRYW